MALDHNITQRVRELGLDRREVEETAEDRWRLARAARRPISWNQAQNEAVNQHLANRFLPREPANAGADEDRPGFVFNFGTILTILMGLLILIGLIFILTTPVPTP